MQYQCGLVNKEMETLIVDFVESYREKNNPETIWRTPVVGFADAGDPLFSRLKKIISPTHAMPQDILPGARSVIAYFIPFSEDIVKSNSKGTESSREWDYACIETNILLGDLNRFLYEEIMAKGFRASLLPPTYNYDEEKLVSDWSHKSAAFIAGVGTFGIHHVLITERGCCGRVGSIITDMPCKPTPRPEREYCLYKQSGKCKKCMDRCVSYAFSMEDDEILYDRRKCSDQIYNGRVPKYPIGDGDACGKCMSQVPCSFKIPTSK